MTGPRERVGIISDDLGNYIVHPTTGRRFISRSRFMQETADTGGYHVGNDFVGAKPDESWAKEKVDIRKHFEKAERALKWRNDEL